MAQFNLGGERFEVEEQVVKVLIHKNLDRGNITTEELVAYAMRHLLLDSNFKKTLVEKGIAKPIGLAKTKNEKSKFEV